MSEHNGVRMACPQCTWSCVMHNENELPPGVNHMEEGVPFCPNCSLPMKPAGSVPVVNGREHGAGPSPGLGEGLPLAERLAKIREAEGEVASAEAIFDRCKQAASDAKKVFDGKVVTLRTLVRQLTSVVSPAPLPLFDQSLPSAEDVRGILAPCGAVGPVADRPCTLITGHEGPHVNLDPDPVVRDAISAEPVNELSMPTVSWPNEAEAMAPVISVETACFAPEPDGERACTRVKGHTGPHVLHSIVGEVGEELARWPQDAPASNEAEEINTADVESREDEALPLPKKRARKKSQAEANA